MTAGVLTAKMLVTIVSLWLVGSRCWWGWALGIVNELLWFALIAVTGEWWLLPLAVALLGVYIRNLVKWRRADA